jgi:hypothetical protein
VDEVKLIEWVRARSIDPEGAPAWPLKLIEGGAAGRA